MKLLIVIVNYGLKSVGMTIDCLRSLADEIPTLDDAKVGLCDNGSEPEAAAALRRAIDERGWGHWIDLTVIHPNQGFTGGNNAVIRPALASAAPPRYIHLLNNDTIAQPGSVRTLVEFLDAHPDVGIVGSRLENPDGTPQHSAYRFQSIWSELDRGMQLGIVTRLLQKHVVAQPISITPGPADWVCGASLMIRRTVLDLIGPLDEDLYTYYDDIDWCKNAARFNWPTWYVPESRVVHLGGRTTGVYAKKGSEKRRPSYWFQARRHYFLKNHGPLYTAACDAAFILGFTTWRLRRILQRKPDTAPSHMLRDAIRHSVFLTGFKKRPVPNPALVSTPV